MDLSDPYKCTNGADFWRIHIVFDKDSKTGGFTADLIQPFCQISLDVFDFDVNLFCLKKDWKNAMGLKIDLSLRPINPINPNYQTMEENYKKYCL